MNEEMKYIIELATLLVLSRSGDVSTKDGSFATVDENMIIELESAIAKAFELKSDDVNNTDFIKIMDYLNKQ